MMRTAIASLLLLLAVPGVIGRGFVPQSILKEFKRHQSDDTSRNDRRRASFNRELQGCPPVFNDPSMVCTAPLDTTDKFQACAALCGPAQCCTDGTCCEGGCPNQPCNSCQTYLPCQILSSGPPTNGTDPGLSSCSVLSVNYYQGWNLHFGIDESEARSLMPYSWFEPFKLSLEDASSTRAHAKGSKSPKNSEPSKKASKGTIRALSGSKGSRGSPDKPGYYASFYAATIGVEVDGLGEVQVGRADLFTYAIDPYGDPSLVFLAAISEVPLPFQNDQTLLEAYKKSILDLSLDSTTGEPAYPHYFVFDFHIDDIGFMIGRGDLQPADAIEIKTDCEGRSTSFSQDFVLANSLAYRSTIDKNVNYFNKDFIAAAVQSFPVNNKCLPVIKLQFLLDALPNQAVFESAQFYGDADKAITWQYEDSTISSGTPYLTVAEKEDRINFKRLAFSSIWAQRAGDIASGTSETLLQFFVDINSLYINWEISEDGVMSLSNMLNLPALGLEMIPISIVADEEPHYILSLNAYVSTIGGLDVVLGPAATGVRFEYSIYVRDTSSQDHRPYYLVIEAISSIDTIDPVSGPVNATDVSHSRIGDTLSIGSSDLMVELLISDDNPLSVEKGWLTANDRVYWSNGVADQVFFDKSLTLQHPSSANIKSISGDFQWKQFLVDAENPVNSFAYPKPLNFVIMPWSNLGQLPPQVAGPVQALKTAVYPPLAELTSTLISTGLLEPLVDVHVYGKYPDTPKVYLNFEIPSKMLEMMERAIGLPDQYHIVPMAMTDKSESKYIMSVTIIDQSLVYGRPVFKQAAWSVYITDESGHIFRHEFHTERSAEGLDIDEDFPLKQPAEIFEVTSSGNGLDVLIKNGNFRFAASVNLPNDSTAERISLSNEWVHAHDRLYWKKGVYDNVYYNGGLWDAKVIPADIGLTSTSLMAPWAEFVNGTPIEVYYFDADVILVSNPWFNIEEI